MKDEPRSPLTKHQLEHPLPTVIHHPEEDMPLLEQWLRRAMANPGRFWSLVAGAVVVLAVLAVLGSGFTLGGIQSDKAWIDVTNAKTAGERTEIAKEFPNTIASHWALLQAATEYYNEGFADLPANRDAAGAKLQKAQGLFEEVSEKAPKDSPLAREAALGLARTFEARNMLEKAIKQYENVAKAWPGTAEAKLASAQADELRKPESEEFYKQLYAFKPSTATLPPGGSTSFPGLPPNHPPILPGVDPSSILVPPPPEGKPAGEAGATTKEMPAPVLLPPAPKAEEKPKAELPADVFSPGKPKP
jgi:tetratricopeptide (TPR) repeat protein